MQNMTTLLENIENKTRGRDKSSYKYIIKNIYFTIIPTEIGIQYPVTVITPEEHQKIVEQ